LAAAAKGKVGDDKAGDVPRTRGISSEARIAVDRRLAIAAKSRAAIAVDRRAGPADAAVAVRTAEIGVGVYRGAVREREARGAARTIAARAARAGNREYLGLGENTPPSAAAAGLIPAAADRDCTLPLSSWSRPISAKELQVASSILEPMDPGGVQVVTGDAFTDTGLVSRNDLKDYRIIHFATHGVVTARAAKCPAQPALLTSFGGSGSDGLLTFREIFDLQLDADLVILSACDTAASASTAATQQAGLATGGDVALDGLVRAFVGAGGRLIIASHWPVPDDFNATQRLITGLFSAPPGTPTVTALRLSQEKLMDDVNTSHPFYWSAFAAVGDGEIPVIRPIHNIAQAK
jgi:hypothetical protein